MQEAGVEEIAFRHLSLALRPQNQPGVLDQEEKLIVTCLRYNFPCLAKRVTIPQESEYDTPAAKFRIESMIQEVCL